MVTSTSRTDPVRQLSNIRVLVVDNDRRIAELLLSILESLGFSKIVTCYDGEEALTILREQAIDFMICDWLTGPVDGLQLVELVRREKQGKNQRIPIVMLSGSTERPRVETARDSGITEYMAKPFTARSLCSRIIAIIENPRSFVMSEKYSGHSSRRKNIPVENDRRGKKTPN